MFIREGQSRGRVQGYKKDMTKIQGKLVHSKTPSKYKEDNDGTWCTGVRWKWRLMTIGLGRGWTFMLGLTTLEEKKNSSIQESNVEESMGIFSSGGHSTCRATKLVS